MRAFLMILTLALLVTVATVGATDYATEFYMAIGDYYDVPYEDVDELGEEGIVDEDLAVVYFVAKRARVSPQDIAQERLIGGSWSGIASSYRLDAGTFYMIVAGNIKSKVYAALLGKFSDVPQSEWSKLHLTDAEIVNLVNLKFVGSHHDYTVFDIMAMRDYGKTFVRINNQARVSKEKLLWKQQVAELEKEETVLETEY